MSKARGTSQNHDGGRGVHHPIKRSSSKHLSVRPPKRMKGVGRYANRHYDPVTGRKIEK